MSQVHNQKFDQLRQKAEDILSQSQQREFNAEINNIQQLFHDISVFQIELELQNDELRKTNLLLENVRNEFAYLYNNAPVAYLTVDKKSFIKRYNQTFAHWIRIDTQNLVNRPLSDFIADEDKTIFLGRFKAIFKEPENKKMDVRFLTKEGHSFYGQITARKAYQAELVSNNDTMKEELLIAITDITSRIEMEKALQISEERLNQAQEVVGLGNWELDLNTNKIWGSEGAFRVYGIERKSPYLPYEMVKSIPLETEREKLDTALKNLILNEIPYDYEFEIQKNDTREVRTIHAVAKLIKDISGKPIKVRGVIQDITQQKKAQEDLRKSEIEFRTLFNQAAVGVAITNVKTGKFTKTNARFTEILGYNQEELLTLDYQSISHPDDLTLSHQVMKKLLHGEINNFSIEKRYITKSGKVIWGAVTVSPMWNLGEEPTQYIAVLKDITERKEIQQKIQDHLNFLSILINTIPNPIFFKDRQGRYIGCNDMFANQVLGLSKEDVIGKTLFDLHQSIPEELALIYHQQDLVLYKTEKVQVYEAKVKCANGTIKDYVFNKALIKNANEEIDGLVGVMLDITDRKMIEEHLANSEKRYRAVIQTASDAIVMADSQGRIIEWNLGAEKIFQYQRHEILNQSITKIMPSEYQNTHSASLKYVAQGGEPRFIGTTIETVGLRKDQSEFPIELALSTWDEANNNFFTAIIRDITERKNFESMLEYKSTHDSLTGLFNRTYYEVELIRLQKSRRYPITIIVIDVDGLKRINDTKGHKAGDDLLRQTADLLRKSFRPEDMIARIGGDEFVIVLPETTNEDGNKAINRLSDHVKAKNNLLKSNRISISIGSASTQNQPFDLEELFKLADNEMYKNKNKKKET